MIQGSDLITHRGGCHCRRVVFEVDAPANITVQDCNCSLCSLTGFLHLIVPRSAFRLTSGHEFLTEYTFNTGVAKHPARLGPPLLRLCVLSSVAPWRMPF